MRIGAVAAILLLVALPAAPQEGSATDRNEVSVSDPAGDAWDYNPRLVTQEVARNLAYSCPIMPSPAFEECRGSAGLLDGTVPPIGGVPAPGYMDVIGGTLRDDGTYLVAEIEVADMPADVTELQTGGGLWGSLWAAAWFLDDAQTCMNIMYGGASPVNGRWSVSGTTVRTYDACPGSPEASHHPWDGRCTSFVQCFAGVNTTFVPGTPGLVRIEIPRADLAVGPDLPAQAPFFASARIYDRSAVSTGIRIGGPTDETRTDILTYSSYIVDATSRADPLPLVPHILPPARPAYWEYETLADTGSLGEPQRDIVGTSFEETPTHITIRTHVAELADPPEPISVTQTWNLPSGHGFLSQIGFGKLDSDGEFDVWAHYISSVPGKEAFEPVPVEAWIEPGSPGAWAFRYLRADLPPIAAGDRMKGLIDQTTGPIELRQGDSRVGEYRMPFFTGQGIQRMAPSYTFQLDPAPGNAADVVSFDDAAGDSIMPTEALLASPAAFDLTSVEARVIDSETARILLGIGDLRAIEVPATFDAVFYGLGVQTPDGQFTVGLYSDGSAAPRGICGPDATIFADPPADPTTAAGIDVQAIVMGGGGEGLISLEAPLACFGLLGQEDVELSIDRMTAATYLIRGQSALLPGTETVHQVDVAEGADVVPATLVFNTTTATTPFWVAPFGVENFWDISGIALAVLLALGSAFLIARRRMRFRHYLKDIDRILAGNRDEDGKAEALVALEDRLKRDLMRVRIPGEHFGIVSRRIEVNLSHLRVGRFEGAFGDLPIAAGRDLERFLRDGILSREDRDRILDRLRSHGVGSSKIRQVAGQLDVWVAEDAARGSRGAKPER